ncbi:MAG TPA: RdgB/HAM1 family non-canonical purine NTP pyrophosphatase [Kiritimatiellia bacterium]|nr:RdgB/HAM1 family non-canonical purine NTP pyrophosphatase [Kiritimatiellia bacterium]HPS08432.1 RdgB/HAM1 family non-canonical purine NTP pyrophosphatase [Kiritimatiellia bacterium]
MKLLVATRNRHKLEEILQIFALPGLTLLAADELPGLPEEVVEDADTFEGNALKKARELCAASGLWTLADDSGLEVGALNNAPGVYSARYAGEPCSYPANNAKLLREMAGVTDRRARFRCALALCAPDGREWTVDGSCPGRIIGELRGSHGFGYDPLFVPDGYDQTFAELDGAAKNLISHRGVALRRASEAWHALLAAM